METAGSVLNREVPSILGVFYWEVLLYTELKFVKEAPSWQAVQGLRLSSLFPTQKSLDVSHPFLRENSPLRIQTLLGRVAKLICYPITWHAKHFDANKSVSAGFSPLNAAQVLYTIESRAPDTADTSWVALNYYTELYVRMMYW